MTSLRRAGELGLVRQRDHRHLDRRHVRVQAQHAALLVVHDVLVVGVQQHREEDAVHAHRGLDDGQVTLVRRLVEVLLVTLPECSGVLRQVVVAARRDAPQLPHAERELEHDVRRPLRVKRELRLRVVVSKSSRSGLMAQHSRCTSRSTRRRA